MEADLPPERPKEEIPTSELMTRFRKVKDEQPEFRPHFKTNPNFDVMVVSSLDGIRILYKMAKSRQIGNT